MKINLNKITHIKRYALWIWAITLTLFWAFVEFNFALFDSLIGDLYINSTHNEQHYQNPTETIEKRDDLISRNKSKITWFLQHINLCQSDEWTYLASNNIYSRLSRKFPQSKIETFCVWLTDSIKIDWEIELAWDVILWAPKNYWYSTHRVNIVYGHWWKEYKEKWYFKVRLENDNEQEHHISEADCEQWSWPFCLSFQ